MILTQNSTTTLCITLTECQDSTMNISHERIFLLITVMLTLAALLLTMKSMTDLKIAGNYLFPICRPTSGTWSTSSQGLILIYGAALIEVIVLHLLGQTKYLLNFVDTVLEKTHPKKDKQESSITTASGD